MLAGLASCGKIGGSLKPRSLPETLIFVEGPLDTVNHVVTLHWFGTDEAGFIAGYEVRLLNPEQPADSSWRFTASTDTVITVFTPQGAVSPVFEVRAVDDHGDRDPTPARQLFNFRNTPPMVQLTLRPRRATRRSPRSRWAGASPTRMATRRSCAAWSGSTGTRAIQMTTGTTFTMPSDRFLVSGAYTDGPRTLYVRAIDDGGMAGPAVSVTWPVKRPVTGSRARLLIVDDVPRTNPSNALIDTLYENTAIRNLPADQYQILRLDYDQPFASAKDLEQTCKLFEAVVWYRANETAVSTTLRDYQDGLGPYLEAGGKFYLDGLYLFSGLNATGALREDFATRYLDCDGFLKTFVTVTAFTDSTIGWSNVNGSVFVSTTFADTTRQQQLAVQSGQAGGFRVFLARQRSEVALMASPGAVTPALPDSLPVGISVPQPGGGRAIILCVPLATSLPRNASTNAQFMAKVFAQMGLTGP